MSRTVHQVQKWSTVRAQVSSITNYDFSTEVSLVNMLNSLLKSNHFKSPTNRVALFSVTSSRNKGRIQKVRKIRKIPEA